MSGPISYVKGLSWEAGGSETGESYVNVSTIATDLPSKFWLRGLQFGVTLSPRIINSVWIDVCNGSLGAGVAPTADILLFRLYRGVQLSPDTAILPDDCYWAVDQGLYLYADGDAAAKLAGEDDDFIEVATMTVFFTA